jgi:hypothetical protein
LQSVQLCQHLRQLRFQVIDARLLTFRLGLKLQGLQRQFLDLL